VRRWQVIGIAILGLAFISGKTSTKTSPMTSSTSLGASRSESRGASVADTSQNAVDDVYAELSWRHTGLAERDVRALAEAIVAESDRHEFDWRLVIAVIQVESGGYNFAKSRVGALGLMQIMPKTGLELATRLDVPWHGPDSLLDPVVNVKLGVAYLRELSDRYDGSWQAALAAYNWGPARIDSRLRRGMDLPRLYVEQVRRQHLTQLAASS
jgi:soluble lytic murein transglycosylase